MNKNNRKINTKKIIACIFAFLLFCYFIYTFILLLKNSEATVIVENGTVNQMETVVGYIIRNEEVIENKDNLTISKIKSDGTKTSKSEVIYKYENEQIKQINEKINSLDKQINLRLDTLENLDFSSKIYDDHIETLLYNLSDKGQISENNKIKLQIDELLSKRIDSLKIDDEVLNSLINQKKYEQSLLNEVDTSQKAPISGLVSYRVDGYESLLNFNSFEDITKEKLNQIQMQTGSIIQETNTSAKVCSSFNNYIVIFSKSENAKQATINQKVEFRTTDGTAINGKLEYIKEYGDDEIMLVFSINTYLEKLLSYRKLSFNLVWWEQKRLKLPNTAIYEKDGLNYVVRTRNGYKVEILVNVKKQNTLYSIVDNYTAEELQNLGFTQSQIVNSKNISIYDEIVLDAKKYFKD